MKDTQLLFRFLLALFLAIGAQAEKTLKVSGLFNDNMVLQRETQAPIWGWTSPGKKVVVTGSWNQESIETVAAADGKWTANLKTPKAGGPHEIKVSAAGEEMKIQNILSGDVWICGGQSNMEWTPRMIGVQHLAEEITNANYPEIRFCNLPSDLTRTPQQDTTAPWKVCNSDNIVNFSIVAYFFGSRLHQELDVPIGLVSANKGGSSAEAWMREETLREKFPVFSKTLDSYSDSSGKPSETIIDVKSPSLLYNGVIKPLAPFAMKGTIWYQGESNVGNPGQYQTLFPALIKEWRDIWDQGNFPFYFVQIAPFHYNDSKYPAALLREAQTMALSVPETGMAVTMDLGDKNDIHPKDKKPVGERLARLALARTYGKSGIVDSGPMFQGMKVEENKVRLSFSHIGGGLSTNDGGDLRHFTIAGSDKVFHPAMANIDGDTIIVSSDKVKAPEAVRFGWGNADDTNFINKAGLPSPSFRTDDWPHQP